MTTAPDLNMDPALLTGYADGDLMPSFTFGDVELVHAPGYGIPPIFREGPPVALCFGDAHDRGEVAGMWEARGEQWAVAVVAHMPEVDSSLNVAIQDVSVEIAPMGGAVVLGEIVGGWLDEEDPVLGTRTVVVACDGTDITAWLDGQVLGSAPAAPAGWSAGVGLNGWMDGRLLRVQAWRSYPSDLATIMADLLEEFPPPAAEQPTGNLVWAPQEGVDQWVLRLAVGDEVDQVTLDAEVTTFDVWGHFGSQDVTGVAHLYAVNGNGWSTPAEVTF